MTYSCYSGNFSSHSCRGHLGYPRSFCGSSYPRNLVYSTKLCSSSTCQLGSSLYSGCQKTFVQPRRCQTSYVVSRPCQRSCYLPRASVHCSPCQTTYAGSLGFGSSSCHSLGYGSRSSCSLGYGSRSCYSSGYRCSGFRPLSCGARGCSSFGYGSGFCYPTYLTSRSCQSSCYRPTCGSTF